MIVDALAAARQSAISISPAIFDFLRDVLLLKLEVAEKEREEVARFTLRFQQLTGAVMAKAVEDTAFYRYGRLLALNEVGGLPSKFGTKPDELHDQSTERARSWPLSMITTSTHDSKRGEDTNVRIAAITELAPEWIQSVRRWSETLAPFRHTVDGERAPSAGHEYAFYQALVGAWPFGWDGMKDRDALRDRTCAFMEKASKEAKDRTLWTNPNAAYDEALQDFVRRAFENETFMSSMRLFCDALAVPAAVASLAAVAVKLCAPGVPDTYQGSELWNQSLVDPDNRRPIDFDLRRRLLADLGQKQGDLRSTTQALMNDLGSGQIKLHVVSTLLRARGDNADLFRRGDYEALPNGDNVFAFTRTFGDARIVCAVPRLVGARCRS
ncbi:MAG: malto-oligosyltrehalose synthase, partial [Polyangiaceae bacterium]